MDLIILTNGFPYNETITPNETYLETELEVLK